MMSNKMRFVFLSTVFSLMAPCESYAFPWGSSGIDQSYIDNLNNGASKYLPITGNDGLVFTRLYIMSSNKTINYYYMTPNPSLFLSNLPKGALMDSFKYSLAGRYCFPKENKIFIENGYTANFIYKDSYGNDVYNISIKSTECLVK